MSKFEKAKERIRLKPNDYTFAQASFLLSQMGFVSSKNFLPALRELKADRIFLQFFPFSHILNCREMSSTINIFKRMIKKPINTLKKPCIHTGNRSREVIQKRRVYVQKKEKRYSR